MEEKGFTALSVKVNTQELVKAAAPTFGLAMYELVHEAVLEYISNHTHADLSHTRAASDSVGERRQS